MNKISAQLKDVPANLIPANGTYRCIIGGASAVFRIGIYKYDVDLEEGVRGINIPGLITILDGTYFVTF